MAYYIVAGLVAVGACLLVGRTVGRSQRAGGAPPTRAAIIAAAVGTFAGGLLGVLIALGAEPLGVQIEQAGTAAVAALVGFGGACAALGGSRL